VPIDVLTLPPLSGGTGAPIFLQQAAYLTEGVYWRWNGKGGLLQYLHVRPPISVCAYCRGYTSHLRRFARDRSPSRLRTQSISGPCVSVIRMSSMWALCVAFA
jgi:transcription initiation factor TFIIH subunit 3